MNLKLNNKRTILVGLAFLSICAFWQMYNSVIPKILTYTFHLDETYSGVIMAADNVLALFLLPLFGAISDKSRSRMGRRLVLRRQTTTVYAGEVFEIAPYYGMDEDLLRRSFSLIQGTWNNS